MSAFDRAGLTPRGLPRELAFGVIAFMMAGAFSPGLSAGEHDACVIREDHQPLSPEVMEIRLLGDVGSSMAHQLFFELDHHLMSYPTLKTIKILLASEGGHAEAGFMIHNYLQGLHQRHGLQVITHNIGSVQLGAIGIYCAGNQRITSPYSFFMVHDGSIDQAANSDDVHSPSDVDGEKSVIRDASYALFSACTNLTLADAGKMFAVQSYIDPDRAHDLGLAHSIQPATFDRSADIRCVIEARNDGPSEDQRMGDR